LAAILGGIIGGVSYYTLQAVLNADPCLGVQWHWQEALFWGGSGGVIGGLIGAAAYGGWQLGAKTIAWLRAIFLGGGGAAGATIVRTLQSADLSAIKQFIQDAIRINGGRWGFTYGEKWQEMFDNLARLRDQFEVFAVRTGDRITGLMQVARQPIVHNGENALLVRYMEGLGGGAGTALLQKAYQFSLESGFGGRILLYATDQSRAWYMTHFPGFTYDAAQDIFYWSTAAAKAAFGQ
jgi:hypothetical protein